MDIFVPRRNDIAHVARFLSLKHYGKFRVYNLCEEHEGNYHPQLLYSQMRRVAFDDHNPPAIKQVWEPTIESPSPPYPQSATLAKTCCACCWKYFDSFFK